MKSEVPAGWTEVNLSEVASVTAGQSPSGSDLHENGVRGGTPFYQGCKDFGRRTPQPRVYTDEGIRFAACNDVLISLRAPVGRVNIASERCAIGRGLAAIRGRQPDDSSFLRWVFSALEKRWHAQEASGSVFGNLGKYELLNLNLLWPDASERARIASVLGALDDKIESNRRLASTLEEVAAALFRARFVDFVDVEDFEDSEIGQIPRGWRAGPVGDLVDVIMGQSPPGDSYSEDPDHGILLVQGMGGFGLRYPDSRVYTSEPKKKAGAGATLMTVRAPVGAVNVANAEVCIGRGVAAFQSEHPAFAEFFVRSLKPRWGSHEAGTIFPAVNRNQIIDLLTTIPSPADIAEFETCVSPLVECIAVLDAESSSLTGIRDSLLPKLISGELRVPDSEDPEDALATVAEEAGAA